MTEASGFLLSNQEVLSAFVKCKFLNLKNGRGEWI
jgi:hypothetical protein